MKVVPPGGAAGMAQMTPASRQSLMNGLRMQTPRHLRKGTKESKRYKKNAKALGVKPAFGSAEWQRKYGRKRKRKSGKKKKKR